MIHVLLTRTPLYSPLRAFSFDLHVLGAPPALILSRDQTLILSCEMFVVPVEFKVHSEKPRKLLTPFALLLNRDFELAPDFATDEVN